jgi:hypothetical protein
MAFKMNGSNFYGSPMKQRLTKGGEGQDENKIFDNKGNHVGDWKDGKKVMKKIAKESMSELVASAPVTTTNKKKKK